MIFVSIDLDKRAIFDQAVVYFATDSHTEKMLTGDV